MQAISSITMHRAHEPLEGDLAKRARRAYIAGWAFWIVFIPLLACPLFALMLIGMVENTYDFEWFTQHITIASQIYFLLLLLPGLILTIIAIWARQCRQWGWREPAEMRFARKLFERARQRIESHLREGERVIAFTIALPLYNGALSDAVVAVIAFCGIGWWTLCQFIAPRIRSIYGSGIPPIWWFDVTNTIIPSLVYIGALVALLILVRILHPGSSVHVASSLIYATACAIMSFAMMVNMRVNSTQFYIIATVLATIGVAIFATMHAVDIAMMLLMRSYRIIVRTNNTWRLFAASLLGRVKPLNNGRITVERWCEKLNGVELKIAMREASRASYYKLLFPNRSLANDFVNAVRMENQDDATASPARDSFWRSHVRIAAQVTASIALYALFGIPWMAGSLRLGQEMAIAKLLNIGMRMLKQYADVGIFEMCIAKARCVNENSLMTTLMQGIGAQLKHDMQQARYYYQMVSKRIGMRMLQLSAMARLREIDREEKLMSALRQKAVNMARRMGCHPEAVLHLLLARAFENTPSTLYRMANKHHVAFHLRKAVTIDPTLTDAKLQLVKYERQLELLQTAGRYWLYNKGRW